MELNPAIISCNETNYFSSQPIFLHCNIIEILYGHYFLLKRIFNDIQTSFDLDYFSMTIIDPSNQLISVSTHPNIEFNLIHSGLWRSDKTFSSKDNPENGMIWWKDECYTNNADELRFIKLLNNQFSWGSTLCLKSNSFCVLYGFAGVNYSTNFSHFSLFREIGDYMYHQLSEALLTEKQQGFPHLNIDLPKIYKTKTTQFLRVIG